MVGELSGTSAGRRYPIKLVKVRANCPRHHHYKKMLEGIIFQIFLMALPTFQVQHSKACLVLCGMWLLYLKARITSIHNLNVPFTEVIPGKTCFMQSFPAETYNSCWYFSFSILASMANNQPFILCTVESVACFDWVSPFTGIAPTLCCQLPGYSLCNYPV